MAGPVILQKPARPLLDCVISVSMSATPPVVLTFVNGIGAAGGTLLILQQSTFLHPFAFGCVAGARN